MSGQKKKQESLKEQQERLRHGGYTAKELDEIVAGKRRLPVEKFDRG